MDPLGKLFKFQNKIQSLLWQKWVSVIWSIFWSFIASLELENESDSEDDLPLAQVKKSASFVNGKPEVAVQKPEAVQEGAEGKQEGPEMEVDLKPKENLDWSIVPTLKDEDSWFVYSSKEDIENLTNWLNERGEREKELKSNISKM